MILFLYGKDNFRSLRKLKEIVTRYKKIHKSGLNLKYFDLKKDSFEDFKIKFQTRSMFKEKKLFVLKNAFSNPKFKEKFQKQKEEFQNSKNIILFYESGEVSKNDPFFLFLKENSISQEFDLLEGKKLENWIKREFARYNAKIQPTALKIFIEYVGNDIWCLSNEIEKLVNYKGNQKNIEISKEDVKTQVIPKIQPDIFKTIDFIAKKQKERAIFLIHNHLKEGDSPLYILAMINFQFRNLLMIKERLEKGKSLNALNLHPFIIKKCLLLSQKFTLKELKRIYQKIFETDLNIKTGKIDPELALDLFISQI